MTVFHLVSRTALHLSPDMLHQTSSGSHLLHLPRVQERGAKSRQVTRALQQRLALKSSPEPPEFPTSTSTALSYPLGASKRRISPLSHHHTDLCSPWDQMSALLSSLHVMQEMMQEKLLHMSSRTLRGLPVWGAIMLNIFIRLNRNVNVSNKYLCQISKE